MFLLQAYNQGLCQLIQRCLLTLAPSKVHLKMSLHIYSSRNKVSTIPETKYTTIFKGAVSAQKALKIFRTEQCPPMAMTCHLFDPQANKLEGKNGLVNRLDKAPPTCN